MTGVQTCALPILLSTIGSYSINNRISDVYMMLAFGLIGYLFKKVGLPTAPIILGLLLESTGEQGFKNAILMAKDTPVLLYYLQRPASLVLILLIVATVIVPTIQSAVKACLLTSECSFCLLMIFCLTKNDRSLSSGVQCLDGDQN